MPSLLQRVNLALRVFREGVSKDAPYVWPMFQGGQAFWRMDNFKSYAAEGYNLNSIIHSAVNYKGRTLALGRLVAYQGDIDKPVKLDAKHPLQQLLLRPNPYQSWMEFQWQRETYLNLSGNSYTWLDRPKPGALPMALWNLRPDRVYIVPNDRRLMGYLYVPDDRARENGIPMLPEDMIHIKFPNPLDRFEGLGYGLSPLAPMAQSGDVDNAVTRYLKVFFERGSMPPGVLKTTLPLTDGEIADARARWQLVYGGVDNWTDIAVLDKDLTYSRVGFTFEEMGFDAIDGRNETRMLGPLGVPAILIGVRVGLMRSTFCISSGEFISTLAGLERIEHVLPGTLVWSFENGELRPKRVLSSQQTGMKTVYEIKTRNRTLRATDNHPVLVRVAGKKNGAVNADRHARYAWKTVAELQIGDYVVQTRSFPDQGGDQLPDGALATVEFMKFCGALLGDGTVQENGAVQMCMPPQDRCRSVYQSLAEQLFKSAHGHKGDRYITACLNCGREIDNNPYRYFEGRGRFCSKTCQYADGTAHFGASTRLLRVETLEHTTVTITNQPRSFSFRSVETADYLRGIGFGGRAHTKRIPKWVYALRRELRLALIAGLVDSDGSIGADGILRFAFCNRELTYDLRELMISVGLRCTNVRERSIPAFRLPQKGAKLAYQAWDFASTSYARIAEIPFEDARYRAYVDANADREQAEGFDAAKAGLSDDLGFYRIRSITKLIEEPVYDLEIEGAHSFVASGIVVHNSNAIEARKACWQDTLAPEQLLFHSDDEYYLGLPDEEIFVQYDNSAVPALQEDRVQLVGAWSQLVDRGVPVNQAFNIMGIKAENVPDGDTAYRSTTMAPVGVEVEPISTNEGAPSADDESREMARIITPQFRLANRAKRLPATTTEIDTTPLKKKDDGIAQTSSDSGKPPTALRSGTK